MTTPAPRSIKQLIADLCRIDIAEVRDDGRLLGYGIDSVRMVDLLVAIETAYELSISEDDPELRGLRTVGDLAAFVQRRRCD